MSHVTIFYGPYMSYGVINHRLQKTNGLFGALSHLGYKIDMVPISEYNRLSIEMFDREIFRCDIRHLKFNMSAEDDPVCLRAVKAVEDAHYRMSPAVDNIPGHCISGRKYASIVDGPEADHPKAHFEDCALPSKPDTAFNEVESENSLPPSNRQLHSQNTGNAEIKGSKLKIIENKNTILELDEDSEMSLKENDNLRQN